jgi:hypothetical protein
LEWVRSRETSHSGGIRGGLKAQNSGKEFWSGKAKWMEVKIQYYTFGGQGVNFKDSRFNIDNWESFPSKPMGVPQTNQGANLKSCTWACKVSDDKYFGVVGQDEINTNWLNDAENSKKGFSNLDIMSRYENAGYCTNSNPIYSPGYDNKQALSWMIDEMKQNRLVHVGWHIGGNPNFGHASIVDQLFYRSDFSEFKMMLMNPGSSSKMIRTFNFVSDIFSVWRN